MTKIILILILILGFVLRVYHMSQMVGFDFDQEYAAQFAYDVVKVFPVRMIGQGLSVEGLFMGPWYFYYLVPFFMMSSLHPIGGYFGSVVLGLVITLSYFFILKDVFGTRVGLLAAFLRSFLSAFILVDWSMVPSLSSELAVLIVWWCMFKYWQKKYLFLVPLFFVFGMFSSFHPIQFPFYLVFLVIFLMKRNIPPLKYFLLCPIAFIVPLVPLLAFEYFRGFAIFKSLLAMDQSSKAEAKDLSTLIVYMGIIKDQVKDMFGFIGSEIAIGIVVVLGVIRWRFFKNSFHLIFVLTLMIAFLAYYMALSTHVPPYYFTAVNVVFFVYLVAIVGKLKGNFGKIVIPAVVTICFLFSLGNLHFRWTKDFGPTLFDKDNIVREIVKRSNGKSVEINYDIALGHQFGLGYLRRFYNVDVDRGRTPDKYLIVIPVEKGDKVDFQSGSVGLVSIQR